jgi:hypothetical protein
MLKFIVAIFLILHGLVHLLYSAHSWRLFELKPGMVWPEGSWAFSSLLGDAMTRSIASILMVVIALGFVSGGAAILFRQHWWQVVSASSATLSVASYIILWNGKIANLDGQGAIGLLISLAVFLLVTVAHWPRFDF